VVKATLRLAHGSQTFQPVR